MNSPGLAWGRVGRLVLSLLAAGFVLLSARDLWQRWDAHAVHVAVLPLLGAWLLASVAMLAQFLGWKALMKQLGGRALPVVPAARLYLDSQLARYTPGKIGLPAVRIAGAAALGVTKRHMVTGLTLELASWVSVGLIAAGLGLGFAPPSARAHLARWVVDAIAIAASCAGICLIGFMVLGRNRYPQRLLRALGLEGTGPLLPKALVAFFALHASCWMACGTLLAVSLGQPALHGWPAGGALCFSLVGGFLAFLAPAGVGVRELIVGYILAPLWGAPVALSFGLLARAVSLSSDVVLWGVARVLDRSTAS